VLAAPPEVEAAILALLDRMSATMAAGNFDAQRAQFADDPDVAMIGSADIEVYLGASEVDRYYEMVREHAATASFAWGERRVWASGDLAWAYADAAFTYTFDGVQQTLPYRMTLVCRREAGDWRIVLYHGSEPATFENA